MMRNPNQKATIDLIEDIVVQNGLKMTEVNDGRQVRKMVRQ